MTRYSKAVRPIRLLDSEKTGTAAETRIISRVVRASNRLWRRPPRVEVTASFISAAVIQRYSRIYRRIDRPTTTLSFVYQGSGRVADPRIGEIFFCRSVIKARARLAGQPYAAALAELAAHSLLHIRGYDHRTGRQERAMDRQAKKIIKLLS